MTNIIDMAREVADLTTDARGRETFSFDNHGLELLKAAIIAELCAGVEMPEPAGFGYYYKRKANGQEKHVYREGNCYTLDQMREYGAACAAREREACAKVCDELNGHRNDECADAIRQRSDSV